MKQLGFLILGVCMTTSVWAQAPQVFIGAKAKTWLDARTICRSATQDNLKWRLPKSTELIPMFLSLEESKKSANTFQIGQYSHTFMIWVQGKDPKETSWWMDQKTAVLSITDGGSSDLGTFDLNTTLKNIERIVSDLSENRETVDAPKTQVMRKLVASLQDGLTVLCVPAE